MPESGVVEPTMESAFRRLCSWASLCPILYALHMTDVEQIWTGALISLIMFLCLCYIDEPLMIRWIVLPILFRVEENWGPKAFARQSIAHYASIRQRWWYSNSTVGVEALGWLVVVKHHGGFILLGLFLMLLIGQALSFKDRMLSPILVLVWVALASKSIWLDAAYPVTAVYASKLGLLSLAIWRWMGYFFVCGDSSPQQWVHPNLWSTFSALPACVLGPLAELGAGLPYRLFNIWVLGELQRLGVTPNGLIPLAQVHQETEKVLADGWGASAAACYLVDPWVRTSMSNQDPRLGLSWIPIRQEDLAEIVQWQEPSSPTATSCEKRKAWVLSPHPQLYGLESFSDQTDSF